MKLLWHLIKFNFIFHHMRISITALLCFTIVFVGHFFNIETKEAGSDILSYSTSLIFFIIVTKMSLKNSSMFDIKHLLGFPLSKSQIVLQQSFSDLVHFFPVSFVWVYGLTLSFPEYHLSAVFIIFHVFLVMLNMLALNKRIDFARVQHASARFKNSILFLNKYLNMNIQFALVLVGFALILAISKNIFVREYVLFIFTCLLLMFTYFSTLKMLKDESLSYFVARRDIKRMGWKLMIVSVPMVLMFSFQKNIDHSRKIASEANYFEKFSQQIYQYTSKVEGKTDLLKLAKASPQEIEKYMSKNKEHLWEVELMGAKLPHLVAGKANIEGLKKIVQLDPRAINIVGTIKKRTPLFTALNSCHLKTADYLISQGASINHQDIDGNTPIIFAAKSGCLGGVLLLKDRGADLTIANNKEEEISKLVERSGLKAYWDNLQERNVASKKRLVLQSK